MASTNDLIRTFIDAENQGLDTILVEEQYRGSPAVYDIVAFGIVEVEDEEDEIIEDCEVCDGVGEVDDEDDVSDEDTIPCEECGGEGERPTGEYHKRKVLMIQIDHNGYAPGGTRSALEDLN